MCSRGPPGFRRAIRSGPTPIPVLVTIAVVAVLLSGLTSVKPAESAASHPAGLKGSTTSVTGSVGARRGPTLISAASQNVASIPVGQSPGGVVVDPLNGYVYVSNELSDNVSVISGVTDMASISVGDFPSGTPAYDPADGELYVPEYAGVAVIQGLTLVATVTAGTNPCAAVYDPASGDVYVANCMSNNVSVINGTTVLDTIAVGASPTGLAVDPANGYLYVSNGGDAVEEGSVYNISVIDGSTNQVVESIALNFSPGPPAWDPANGYLYVPGGQDEAISVLNGSRVIANVTDAGVPLGTIFDPANEYVYALNGGAYAHLYTNDVSAINGTVNVQSIPTGKAPDAAAFDSANGFLYVANSLSDNVTVIDGTLQYAFPAISATATASPNPTDVNLSVNFTSSSVGGQGAISYLWEFGDGVASTMQDPQHTYLSAGVYTARLWVNTTYGASDNRTVTISVAPALTAALTVSSASVALGQSMALRASGQGGWSPYTYLYGGLPPGCTSVSVSTITCVPSQLGTFHIFVEVTDLIGNTATSQVTVVVLNGTSSSIWQTLDSPVVLGAFVVVGAVVLLSVCLLYYRRKHPPGPA